MAIKIDIFTDNSISAHEIQNEPTYGLTHNIEDKRENDDFPIDQDFDLQAKLNFDCRLRDLS